MLIRKKSLMSGIEHEMDLRITEDQMNDWHDGTPIQEAMPHLTPDEREFLMTGTTPEEWDKMFGVCHDIKAQK
jgi:hypothetical protein